MATTWIIWIEINNHVHGDNFGHNLLKLNLTWSNRQKLNQKIKNNDKYQPPALQTSGETGKNKILKVDGDIKEEIWLWTHSTGRWSQPSMVW